MSQLTEMIKSLKDLESKNSSCKKPPDGSPCDHGFLDYREPTFYCADCSIEITETEFPDLYNKEKAVLKQLGKSDDSDEADTMDRGVTIAFLVEFCTAFDLWDVSVDEVRRNYIIPITCEKRCRFVDLPVLKGHREVVGQADTYILYTRKSKFGDLVSSISDGADPNRRVWLDLFASRQWPCSKTDFFIEYAIQRCPSFLVFCPDPPELLDSSSSSDDTTSVLPAAVKVQVPFFRLWCLYQIYFAAMSNGVSIVLKCGHHQMPRAKRKPSVATFIPNKAVLEALVDKIDTLMGSVTIKTDKKLLMDKLRALPAGCADIDKMNAKLRGVVRAGVALSGDTRLHNAACGDQTSKKYILEAPEDYIHKVAIAGYFNLLVELVKKWPELTTYVDPDTGRTLLMSAVWGGSLCCVNFLVKKPGALIDSKDKFGKSALTYTKEFKYSEFTDYFVSFYIRHKQSQLYVCPDDIEDRSVKLVLQDFDPTVVHSAETDRQFLFRFVSAQLQHVSSGKYAHPLHGRKGPDMNIGLYEESDGTRTCCYPFDYDPTRCLLAGGDNFFVKVNHIRQLVWHQYWNTKDQSNPFDSANGFEFEIVFNRPGATVSAVS